MEKQNRPTSEQRAIADKFREAYRVSGVARTDESLSQEERDAVAAVHGETMAGVQELAALCEQHGPEAGERAYIRKLIAERDERDRQARAEQGSLDMKTGRAEAAGATIGWVLGYVFGLLCYWTITILGVVVLGITFWVFL